MRVVLEPASGTQLVEGALQVVGVDGAYSLIETAKANRREPYAYLRELFEKLPLAGTRADCLALLLGCPGRRRHRHRYLDSPPAY